MTGIVLMNMVSDQIDISEFQMEMDGHPWGLPVPHCGMGCGASGVSITMKESTARLQCVCGAEALRNGRPDSIEEVQLEICRETYRRPFPWTGSLTWRNGVNVVIAPWTPPL